MNSLIGLLIFIVFIIDVFVFCGHVAIETECMCEDRKTVVISALIKVIKGWFINRNLFGIVLSVICVIAVMPGILLLLLVEVVVLLVCLIASIWDFGTKNTR